MNEFEFKQGLEQIEGAKGDPPKEKVIVWLWGEYKALDPNIWAAACKVLTTYEKDARWFTNKDFERAIQTARNEIRMDETRDRYAEARRTKYDRGDWRAYIVSAIEKANTPEQIAFFEGQLRDYDRKHGTGLSVCVTTDIDEKGGAVVPDEPQDEPDDDVPDPAPNLEKPDDYDEEEAGRIPF